MSIAIGEVISVKGINITVTLYEESNKEALFYNGEKFNGVSIHEFILIRRGFKDIVARVQGEYLDERLKDEENDCYIRKVELVPIGYFQFNEFHEGTKHLPMIRDIAYLMSDTQVKSIFGKPDDNFVVGETLTEEIPISLPWVKLFNTHIGIFGNTGSGKSNTLTNIYTTLFRNKLDKLINKSHFVVIDFNGEYTNNQLIPEGDHKKVYQLDTRNDDGDKFPLTSGYVQFDHIQPLLKRVEASLTALDRVFDVGKEKPANMLLSVISLRRTNQEIKKVMPLLLAKFYYSEHKQQVMNQSPPEQTFHMIIDEAHNILSTQSSRESESWKDYRLEL
ncbi:ATP-binding protein [Xenorhabdus sp. PB30.3]|uniref:ATP-binding protein n=1 Tax=Xenorhabdus sp. PB30.3 TaxID=2788941 RepID=UPI001E60DA16|nr:DUF87 domain-containing protein [Xenorhabdus sp. PB30.3]MCC8382034.1 DUF87 domain-containing protein [Xenorhabdus sp. PB30.3]